ncbi:MAG: response regulator [Chroococcidiopsidaceae cyanobacterium CP_BM_RX_35]|nr:response regulator [Chroococcidiopsidaceae cyanobacterium CP_BM_RX_35]
MTGTLRLLVVEDSEDDAVLLALELQRGGYKPVFKRVDNAAALEQALEQQSWDVVISDYSLPQFSASTALKLLQEQGLDIPFIIISGNIGENSAVALMKAGAHDLILKGHLARLVPAIERELREAEERRERKRTEERVRASLKEKEILLKEIHHRVKNNLQILSSLLNLQSESIKDKRYLEIFKVSQSRIESMALLHEKLYHSEDLAKIEFAEYIHDLVQSLFYSYEVSSERIEIKMDIGENIFLGLDIVLPCGLLLNELVLNCLKHAFPADSSGEIQISFQPIATNKFVLIVRDNGIGFPLNFDFKNTKSLGLQLVNGLTSQLGGTIDLDISAGVEFKIIFPR